MVNASPLRIAAVVSAYFVVSILLVFSNKWLMTPGTSIPAPIFVTWYNSTRISSHAYEIMDHETSALFQCVLTALIIYVLGLLGRGSVQGDWMNEFPLQEYKIHVAKRVAPLSFIFVGMITFNNLCLQYVEVSFYNVARSLTIVINVLFTYIFLHEKTSFRTLICLFIVIIGFFIGSEGEVNFSLKGTIFGVMSSTFVSLNSIYTKKVMPLVQDDKWKLAYYNNMNASVMFIPMIFIAGEHHIILSNFHLFFSSTFWFLMFIAGILGFLIGIVTVMQITYTSPLTHNISGTAKACVQTVFAFLIWKNPYTTNALLGVVLTIFGSMAYAVVRMNEVPIRPPPPQQASPIETRPLRQGGAEGESDVELQERQK